MIFFVSTTSLHRCHKKILIFKGAFIFHKSLFKLDTSKWIRHDNVISIKNCPSGVRFQQNTSGSCPKLMLAMRDSILFHATNLGPIKSLRQERLGGHVPRTSAMVTCLGLVML